MTVTEVGYLSVSKRIIIGCGSVGLLGLPEVQGVVFKRTNLTCTCVGAVVEVTNLAVFIKSPTPDCTVLEHRKSHLFAE